MNYMTISEVARSLDVPIGTIKYRLARYNDYIAPQYVDNKMMYRAADFLAIKFISDSVGAKLTKREIVDELAKRFGAIIDQPTNQATEQLGDISQPIDQPTNQITEQPNPQSIAIAEKLDKLIDILIKNNQNATNESRILQLEGEIEKIKDRLAMVENKEKVEEVKRKGWRFWS